MASDLLYNSGVERCSMNHDKAVKLCVYVEGVSEGASGVGKDCGSS
jgi:hypothetical protein